MYFHIRYDASQSYGHKKTDWIRGCLHKNHTRTVLCGLQLASRVVYKELFLYANVLNGVSNEQSALVDYLVLLAANSFVGSGLSTFSWFLQEERIMHGANPRNTYLMAITYVGTEELFYTAAVAATISREIPAIKMKLRDDCRHRDLQPCFQSNITTSRWVEHYKVSDPGLW